MVQPETSGAIPENAAHWSIESFIPVHLGPAAKYLQGRDELTDQARRRFDQFCQSCHSIQERQTLTYHRQFSAIYAPLDPDNDCRDPVGPESVAAESPAVDQNAANQVMAMCEEILALAGYRKLNRQEIEQCADTQSQFGVPLHVDFDLFGRLEVYARGDVIGTRMRRRIRNLYRRELVDIPIYQRMVVLFQLSSDDQTEEDLVSSALHLRMFKNIPKQDIDMLLPGTRVRIRGMDRAKFIIPSLGGFLISARRFASYTLLFAFLAINKTIILTVLIVGFLIKSVFSSVFGYFQTKKHYQLNLTRNLYFQKLDCNAGVVYRIIQQAERQSIVEMIFAYYGILISDEAISERRLRRRCERLVREAIDVEVDFRAAGAVARLQAAGLIEATKGGWQAVSPDDQGE